MGEVRNRLFNCTNPYQGEARKVLCVCSAGLLRSPTAAKVLSEKYGYNTRAAGIDIGHALIPVDEVLIAWADEIVCMDERQASLIKDMVNSSDHISKAKVWDNMRVLNVPDIYSYMDEVLASLILKTYEDLS